LKEKEKTDSSLEEGRGDLTQAVGLRERGRPMKHQCTTDTLVMTPLEGRDACSPVDIVVEGANDGLGRGLGREVSPLTS
jgi:hypothetical protein